MDYLQYIGEDPLKMYWRTEVLNLIINGLPSIHISVFQERNILSRNVLNLIINGLPSIPVGHDVDTSYVGFKPYYKWITFNTYEFLRSHKSFCRF